MFLFPKIRVESQRWHAENGIERYIADKVHDVSIVIQIWRAKFPELTDELIEIHVYRWIKKAVIPNLRRACSEKLNHYHTQLDRDDMSTPLKTIIQRCIKKNKNYLVRIDEMSELSDIQNQSTIINPTS